MSGNNRDPMKLAPMRSLNDFLLDFDKYSKPTFNDMKRLNNRITSNLLYYQTNYFAVSVMVFLLFSLFGFNKILIGLTGPLAILIPTNKLVGYVPQLSAISAENPGLVYWGDKLICGLIIMMTFRPMLYFLLAVLIPIAAWIIHASVRSRGLKNKISNKMEQIGAPIYTSTPMGYILSTLGLETKIIDD